MDPDARASRIFLSDTLETDDRSRWLAPWVSCLILAAAYAGVAVVRWRVLDVPLERDEGEYAYFGQLLLRGFPPFRLAYTMKLPGTQVAYAGIMAVLGETARGIRLGLLIVNAATAALVFLLGRRLLGTLGGLVAALVFSWLSASAALLALFGHATHFVLLPAVAGLLVLVRAADSGRLRSFFGAGVLLGTAAVMKQPGAVFVLFAAAWLAWRRLALREQPRGHLLAEEAMLASGAAVPLAVVACWVVLGGTFDVFWQWVFRYAREYSGSQSWTEGGESLGRAATRVLPEAWLLWSLCAAGVALAIWPRWRLRDRAFLFGLLGFSFLGVSAGLYYRPHYFILALPSAALFAGVTARWVEGRIPQPGPALITLTLVAAGGAQIAWAEHDRFRGLTPDEISRSVYAPNPFPEAIPIARYIAQRTGEADRIAVFGSEPEILFYARRLGATGHVYVYGLMELQPFAHAMQEEMAREVVAARPAYLVWVLVQSSWLESRESDHWIHRWAREYLAREYDLVGHARMSGEQTVYAWDGDAARAPMSPGNALLVFRRKDFVPRQVIESR
jgi:hypothetical protein